MEQRDYKRPTIHVRRKNLQHNLWQEVTEFGINTHVHQDSLGTVPLFCVVAKEKRRK